MEDARGWAQRLEAREMGSSTLRAPLWTSAPSAENGRWVRSHCLLLPVILRGHTDTRTKLGQGVSPDPSFTVTHGLG